MGIRIASIPEDQLQVCFNNSLWGSNNNRLSKWNNGDMLIFCVNKEIAAAAEVTGSYDVSDVPLWGNGLFPWRIPLRFTHRFVGNNRIPFAGDIKEAFIKEYGIQYGYVFLNKLLLKPEIGELLLAKMSTAHNDI